jgi:hypothetical protein
MKRAIAQYARTCAAFIIIALLLAQDAIHNARVASMF